MSGTAWFANEIRGRHVLIGHVAFFGLIFLPTAFSSITP